MATLTNSEIITAERALAVMASHATLPATCRVMVERFRRSDLSSLRHSRSDLVAFVASYLLMLEMIKAHAECLSEYRSPRITTQLMTRATRRNVAAA